jgi:hypothetical protein
MITLKKQPFYWSAAHSPVVYEFDYETFDSFSAGEYTNGKMYVTTYTFTDTPVEGDYIFISGGVYKGLHRVASYVVLLGIPFIVTETDFTTTQTSSGETNVKLITSHVFTLRAGYNSGDAFYDDLPLATVATFKPEVDANGLLRFSISGFLKSLFVPLNYTREFEYGVLTYLTGLFNRYILTWDSGSSERMVLNSALTQLELQAYTAGSMPLADTTPPITFTCDTFLVYLNSSGAFLKLSIEETEPDFDPTDFSDTDFVTTIGG